MQDLRTEIAAFINNRSIIILGFGKEGRATYSMLRNYFPKLEVCISDKNTNIAKDVFVANDPFLKLELGELHMEVMSNYELVFKSPGVSLKQYSIPNYQYISSQTDLFLHLFGGQTIGVTATKGKSTTVSLIHHMLESSGKKCLLVGNIGVPAFDVIPLIEDDTIIVYELSSHQLEFVNHSPHIAVFLNLFEEHLDHYTNYLNYQRAKANITKYQNESDILILNAEDSLVNERVLESKTKSNKAFFSGKVNEDASFFQDESVHLNGSNYFIKLDRIPLIGKHNQLNILASLNVCAALDLNITDLIESIYHFKPLPHRLEVVGIYEDIRFVNDSIATIPEACIKAIESFDDLDTLILGGFDRGIDYTILIDFLAEKIVSNLIFIGEVGIIIKGALEFKACKSNLFTALDMDEVVQLAFAHTAKGKTCLMSPAASSYDCFLNFEDRGDQYKKKVTEYTRHL